MQQVKAVVHEIVAVFGQVRSVYDSRRLRADQPTNQPTIHPTSLARTTQGAQLSENHDSAQRLCLVLEKALMFEIRDGIFSRSFFWDYVVNLDQCVPGCKRALNLIKDKATTSAGTRAARSSSERDTGDIRSMMT